MISRFVALVLSGVLLAWGALAPAVQSTITKVEGTSCMGDDKSRKETERSALVDARRNASEYAASLISSRTEVEDLVLKEDLVSAFSQARVEVVKVLEKQWYEEQGAGWCCRIRIQAEVIPDEKAMAEAGKPKQEKVQILEKRQSPAQDQGFDNPALPLQARVWSDKDAYGRGDRVRIYLKGNKPFYALVVYLDADGNQVQLLPNPYRSENYFEGGVTYQIPSGNDRFELAVTPPFGRERVVLYASTSPLGEVETEETGAYYVVTTSSQELGRSVRGLKLQAKSDSPEDTPQAGEFVETQVEIRVEQ